MSSMESNIVPASAGACTSQNVSFTETIMSAVKRASIESRGEGVAILTVRFDTKKLQSLGYKGDARIMEPISKSLEEYLASKGCNVFGTGANFFPEVNEHGVTASIHVPSGLAVDQLFPQVDKLSSGATIDEPFRVSRSLPVHATKSWSGQATPMYESQYQHATGPDELAMILSTRVTPETLTSIQALCGNERVGVLEALKVGGHISETYSQAKQLVEIAGMPHVVIFNSDFFMMDQTGGCTGPLAPLCRPHPDSARAWAATALAQADTELFTLANEYLPHRPDK